MIVIFESTLMVHACIMQVDGYSYIELARFLVRFFYNAFTRFSSRLYKVIQNR